MKKILVTGGAGFIGSNLIRMMLSEHEGYEVVNLDVLSYSGNLENLTGCEGDPRYSFIKGDVSEPDTAASAIEGCDGEIAAKNRARIKASPPPPIRNVLQRRRLLRPSS